MTTQRAPDAVTDEPLSKSRLRLWLKLLKASKLVEDDVRRRLRDQHRSTLPRFDVMSALYRYPDGLKMSEISGLLRVSNGNITGIVDRLTDEGIALRVAIPGDRRASLVKLTPKGVKSFSAQAEEHESWIDSLFANFDADEIDTISTLLDRLNTTDKT